MTTTSDKKTHSQTLAAIGSPAVMPAYHYQTNGSSVIKQVVQKTPDEPTMAPVKGDLIRSAVVNCLG